MSQDTGRRGFGEQLFQRLQDKGLSKSQIYKILALQRLDPEVSDLGAKGLLTEGHLLEISKIRSAPRQKQLSEISVEHNLTVIWVRAFSKLIRAAEKAPKDISSKIWDFYFQIEGQLKGNGPTKELLATLKAFDPDKLSWRDPRDTAILNPIKEEKEEEVELPEESEFESLDLQLGRGLDVGTVNICASAKNHDGEVAFHLQRNAFIDVRNDPFTRKMLMKLGIDYIVQGEKGYVIGNPAFDLANIFERDTRRPMKAGMISPVEPEALLIVSLLAAQILGQPKEVGEVCAFSVPADPVDADRNVIYHRGALEEVLRKLGYSPKAMLEGHALVFSELEEEDYTGIGISCGGGMFNICVAYKSVPALTFSTSRGGDWIDQNVATALNLPAPQVCAAKEGGLDLRNPKNRIEDAASIYYRHLIQYTLETIKQKFESAQNLPHFSHPISIVCAGGTSMPKGFIEIFREEFRKVNFPIEVKDIRMAADPLRAVSRGCLNGAIEETQALSDIQKTSDVMIQRAEVSKKSNLSDKTRKKIEKATTKPEQKADSVKVTQIEVPKAEPTPQPAPDKEKVVPAPPAPEPEPEVHMPTVEAVVLPKTNGPSRKSTPKKKKEEEEQPTSPSREERKEDLTSSTLENVSGGTSDNSDDEEVEDFPLFS